MSVESMPNSVEAQGITNKIIEVEEAVLLVATDPAARHIYEQFMWDFVGDPVTNNFPELTRQYPGFGEIAYDQRILKSYSKEGHLVHVRSSSKVPGNYSAHYLVVTADLYEGTIKEWWVDQPLYTGKGNNLETEIPLKSSSTSRDSEIEIAFSGNPNADMIQYLRDLRKKRQTEPKSWIKLTSHGLWYKPLDNESESLAPIVELQRKVESYHL